MTLFNWLDEISYGKRDWLEFNENDHKSFNSYMITRYISMSQNYIELANFVQKYNQILSPKQIYTIYKNVLPKKKMFFRYIKSNNKDKMNDDLIKVIAEYFECSKEQAKINIKLLNNEQLSAILSDLGKDKKEIKKLLK